MARVSASDFSVRLAKAKVVDPAILLLGDEPYLRDACRAQLIEKLVPEAARTWAISRFSADRDESQAALDQAQSMPMLSPRQIVFLEDAEGIESLGEKNRDALLASLEAYLEDPAPFTVLVVEATSLDMRMRLGKRLAEKMLVVEVGLGDDPEQRVAAAIGLARALAKERGIEFEKGAAEDLAEFVSGDLMRLKTEVEKLSTFAAASKIVRRQDVTTLVVSEKAASIWEVADFLATRQPKNALEFFDRLLREGEEPVRMLGAMAWMYRKLIEASEVRGGTNGWQAAKALGMRPEQAERTIQSARKISKERLLNGLRHLQQADDRLKRGGANARAVMEFLVTALATA
jgi:DNA polymerase III subunit delta